MVRVIKSLDSLKLVETDGKVVHVLATLTPDQANNLGYTLIKGAAVMAALKELKGMADEKLH